MDLWVQKGSQELPWGCAFPQSPSVTANTQNRLLDPPNLPDSPDMTSSLQLTFLTFCQLILLKVPDVKNSTPSLLVPFPEKNNASTLTFSGSCCCPVYHRASTTGCERDLFCQKMACCSTLFHSATRRPWSQALALGRRVGNSLPVSRAFLINIVSLAGEQSRWDPLLSRSVSREPRECPALLFQDCPQRLFWSHPALKGIVRTVSMGPRLYC